MDHVSIPNIDFSVLQGGHNQLQECERNGLVNSDKIDPWFELNSEDIDSLYSVFDLKFQENKSDKQVELLENQQQNISDYWSHSDDSSNIGLPMQPDQIQNGIQPQVPKLGNLQGEIINPISLASLELLNNCGRLFKKSSEENLRSALSNEACVGNSQKMSTEEILQAAGERYIQYSTQRVDGLSMFIHPYASALSALSIDETRDMELVHLLLAAAEEVDQQQFHLASQSIERCLWKASHSGNPIQRLCFYFAEALQERIDRETGRSTSEERKFRYQSTLALGTTPESLTCHTEIPFSQVMQFAGVQAVIENVRGAKKIHLVDFNIRSGIQCTGLMQALAEQRDHPIELLKITAIGHQEKEKIEETGRRLLSFANSLNLPFSFDILFLLDMKDLREELINVKADETVAVYCNTVLRTMICRPAYLDNTMRVIRRLRPSVVVVCEVEANHNSPSFLNRFVDALFFYGVLFDCFEDCMDRDNPCRKRIEVFHLGEGILNIVAAEGDERFTRNVKLNVWRAFFARFGMVEMELSESSWYQANLILKQFSSGSSCNLQNDGKGLLVGWKGTPIKSVTIWKFL